jgi:hypothetical protein
LDDEDSLIALVEPPALVITLSLSWWHYWLLGVVYEGWEWSLMKLGLSDSMPGHAYFVRGEVEDHVKVLKKDQA